MAEMHISYESLVNRLFFVLYFRKTDTGPPKALNHLSFSSILNFRGSSIGPSQIIESS